MKTLKLFLILLIVVGCSQENDPVVVEEKSIEIKYDQLIEWEVWVEDCPPNMYVYVQGDCHIEDFNDIEEDCAHDADAIQYRKEVPIENNEAKGKLYLAKDYKLLIQIDSDVNINVMYHNYTMLLKHNGKIIKQIGGEFAGGDRPGTQWCGCSSYDFEDCKDYGDYNLSCFIEYVIE